jgi:leukotriene-A4 hydrolase
VKTTYTARVTVAQPLTALMSAQTIAAEEESTSASDFTSRFSHIFNCPTRTYIFKQDIPIPSYLLALAVGKLENRTLGPRSRVWAEPAVIDAAAYEFAEVDQFLKAGAALGTLLRVGVVPAPSQAAQRIVATQICIKSLQPACGCGEWPINAHLR